MDNKIKSCKVTIFGDCYSLVTTEAEDCVVQASHLVDSIMREIANKSTLVDEKKVAVLAALRLASKVIQLEDAVDKAKRKENQLVESIEQELMG